ncbi:hypothetical protein AVEN_175824-1 [Araneus ventricosus]|uniref:Uncharacterized protein n=1 Tax=Araneus ventricosus TaxID=182803 RepID=A0A4Y2F107_ARAVE|nr:hypothetical protein AVEN_175824-1 [Araneus ventricosus]
MELMRAIFHSDSNTMRNLTLREFVNEAAITVLRQQYMLNLLEVCGGIANVQSLEVDYTQIFPDIMNSLYEKLSPGDYQLDKKKPRCRMLPFTVKIKDGQGLEQGFSTFFPSRTP